MTIHPLTGNKAHPFLPLFHCKTFLPDLLCAEFGGKIADMDVSYGWGGEQVQFIALDSGLILIDTRCCRFNIQTIRNRRFMFSPESGELILGKQYRGSALRSSHAEEHGQVDAAAPFDAFVRGWIGTGADYRDGVIHLAPAADGQNIELFDSAFSALEMFADNGANKKTVVRGFGGVWEQPLGSILHPSRLSQRKV